MNFGFEKFLENCYPNFGFTKHPNLKYFDTSNYEEILQKSGLFLQYLAHKLHKYEKHSNKQLLLWIRKQRYRA